LAISSFSTSYGPIEPNNKPSSFASAAILIVNPSSLPFLLIAISRLSLAIFSSSSLFASNSLRFSSVAYFALAFGTR